MVSLPERRRVPGHGELSSGMIRLHSNTKATVMCYHTEDSILLIYNMLSVRTRSLGI